MYINMNDVADLLRDNIDYMYLFSKLTAMTKQQNKGDIKSTCNELFDVSLYAPNSIQNLSAAQFTRFKQFNNSIQVANFLLLKLFILVLLGSVAEQCDSWQLRVNSAAVQENSLANSGAILNLHLKDDLGYDIDGQLSILWNDNYTSGKNFPDPTDTSVHLNTNPEFHVISPRDKDFYLKPIGFNRTNIIQILKS